MNIWNNFCSWINNLFKTNPKAPANFLLGSNTWKMYSPTFYDQKYLNDDTDDCWDFSGVKSIAYSCNFLKANGYFSQNALNFFNEHGYLDSNGLFAFSERYISILSGVENNGNDPLNCGKLVQKYGLLPRQLLSYTNEQATLQPNYLDFCADYYNPNAITSDMEQIAMEFLTFVSVQLNSVKQRDTVCLKNMLQIAPYQVGVPVPAPNTLWNVPVVATWSGMKGMNHAVTMIDVNADSSYLIDDQYNPQFKNLATGYLLYEINQYIVNPIN
jgi:hypothetical protein